jgi:hypothetical protein
MDLIWGSDETWRIAPSLKHTIQSTEHGSCAKMFVTFIEIAEWPFYNGAGTYPKLLLALWLRLACL